MWWCKNKPYRQTFIENSKIIAKRLIYDDRSPLSKMKTMNRNQYKQELELRDIQDTITKWLNRDDRFPVQQASQNKYFEMIRYKVNMTSTDRFGDKMTIFYFLDDPLEFKQELFNTIKVDEKLKDFNIEMNENLIQGEIVIHAPSEIFDPVLDEDLKIEEAFQIRHSHMGTRRVLIQDRHRAREVPLSQKMTNESKMNEQNSKHLNKLEKFPCYVDIVTSIIVGIILCLILHFRYDMLDQMLMLNFKTNTMDVDVASNLEFYHLTLLSTFVTISTCIIVSVVLTYCFGFPIPLVFRECIHFLKQKNKNEGSKLIY
jgi:hypothetical protein